MGATMSRTEETAALKEIVPLIANDDKVMEAAKKYKFAEDVYCAMGASANPDHAQEKKLFEASREAEKPFLAAVTEAVGKSDTLTKTLSYIAKYSGSTVEQEIRLLKEKLIDEMSNGSLATKKPDKAEPELGKLTSEPAKEAKQPAPEGKKAAR